MRFNLDIFRFIFSLKLVVAVAIVIAVMYPTIKAVKYERFLSGFKVTCLSGYTQNRCDCLVNKAREKYPLKEYLTSRGLFIVIDLKQCKTLET